MDFIIDLNLTNVCAGGSYKDSGKMSEKKNTSFFFFWHCNKEVYSLSYLYLDCRDWYRFEAAIRIE